MFKYIKQKKGRLFLVLLGVLFFTPLYAQKKIEVGQYMYHHALFNPAAMGSYCDIRGALLVRQQWVGIEGAPKLYALNVSVPFEKMGAGLSLYQAEVGVHKELRAMGSYSYRLQVLKDQYISFGISGGIVCHNKDYTSVITGEENDPLFAADVESVITPDFQLGVYYFIPRFYVGVFVPSILNNEVSIENGEESVKTKFNDKQLHLYLQSGYEYPLGGNFYLNFSTLLRYVPEYPLNVDFNMMVDWNNYVGLGASYRTKKEFLGLFYVRLTENFRLGYAYEYSSIVHEHFSSHEALLTYRIKCKNKKRLKIQSPRF